jgi:hypothetical protein
MEFEETIQGTGKDKSALSRKIRKGLNIFEKNVTHKETSPISIILKIIETKK